MTLTFDMPVRRVAGHPRIAATRGLVALERGAVVYAFEGIDNDGSVFEAVVPSTARIAPEVRPGLLGGVVTLNVAAAQEAFRKDDGGMATRPATLTAIPYAVWANRGLAPMAVWLARDPEHARVAP